MALGAHKAAVRACCILGYLLGHLHDDVHKTRFSCFPGTNEINVCVYIYDYKCKYLYACDLIGGNYSITALVKPPESLPSRRTMV